MNISFAPIAFVSHVRTTPTDDHWAATPSEIVLAPHVPDEAIASIGSFSHLEIVYWFHQVKNEDKVWSGRPRGNPAYPITGIFAQRKKDRPNAIGLCTVELVEVKARTLVVSRLDAIDGTPVLDIKPVFREFQPQGIIRQPDWVSDLMKQYW